jgi:signal transduction histidine kinase
LEGNPTLMRYRGTIGIGFALLIALYLTSLYSYLLFHTVVELFTIVVAGGVFVIAWNAKAYINNNYLEFIAIASVFVAMLDLVHTLAYEGMGVFAGTTSNLATQLWVAGRYLQGVSWLLAPLFLGRKFRPVLQLSAYSAVTVLLLLSIFYWRIFPATYVDGAGLTEFKKVSEYLISLMFLGAIGLLIRSRREFDPAVERFVLLSLMFTISSEIAFTSYVNVYGPANLIGHLLRWVAYYLLYKAIIETGLVKPYAILLRDLKLTDDDLRDHAKDLQARNDELDAYAHTVAHDLKNPLAVIVAAVDVIREVHDLSPKERREYLDQIKVTAFEMNGIVDNLLLLSEVRKSQVPLGPVHMGQIADRVKRRMSSLTAKYGGHVTGTESWPTAVGYAPWIEEVWANYISNALKYGGPSPHIELGWDDAPNGRIRFWTRDHGPGISAEAAASLFVPFRRLRSKGGGGHGLGLSIVLRIVEKLGGEVGVEAADGGGALFYFTLTGVSEVAHATTQSKSSIGAGAEAAPAD